MTGAMVDPGGKPPRNQGALALCCDSEQDLVQLCAIDHRLGRFSSSPCRLFVGRVATLWQNPRLRLAAVVADRGLVGVRRDETGCNLYNWRNVSSGSGKAHRMPHG